MITLAPDDNISFGTVFIIWDAMFSSGANFIIWDEIIIGDEMLSSEANVIIWDDMLSSGMKCYHLG